jgi:hypothetical protein
MYFHRLSKPSIKISVLQVSSSKFLEDSHFMIPNLNEQSRVLL